MLNSLAMKIALQVFCSLFCLTVSCLANEPTKQLDLPEGTRLAELPRPNSGTFSTEQAEARKHEILTNVASKPLKDWEDPLSGFAIHVAADDSLSVYAPHLVTSLDIIPAGKVGIDDIKRILRYTIHFGNGNGILITSDQSLSESKVFPKLMEAIFEPGIQLFYLAKKP